MKFEYKYVCIVQEVYNKNEIEVMAMNCMDTAKTTYRANEADVSCIKFESIIGLLPTPKIQYSGERVRYVFEQPVDVCEY